MALQSGRCKHGARRASRLGCMVLACLVLVGCASDPRRLTLYAGGEPPAGARAPSWPGAPETPRYAYAGELLGEDNFRGDHGSSGGFVRFLRMLAGILAGEGAPTVLQRPQSGAVDAQGRIYVTDASRQAVFVFDAPAGELAVWDKADGLAGFRAPAGIALGPGGDILVADAELGFVARLDAKGGTRAPIGRGALKRPTGLAFDAAAGRMYVADTYAHDIKVFDADGKRLATIGHRGEGDGEFNFPTHLAFARGELYVTDSLNSRVQVFGSDGILHRKLGERGLYVGNLVRPKGVAVDAEGNVYVVESYYDRLLVFNRDGAFLMAIGGQGNGVGQFYLPAGVWVDGGDRVFVADMFNGRVPVFRFLGEGPDHAR